MIVGKIERIIIVGYNKKGVIGDKNNLLWHDKRDLKRFKKLTSGHPIIMGRKTHESIGRVLPDRLNIVISRDLNYVPLSESALVVPSLWAALFAAESIDSCDKIFVIGGGEIYEQSLPLCDTLYVSEFDNYLSGDTYFPRINDDEWEMTLNETAITHRFQIYKRIKNACQRITQASK